VTSNPGGTPTLGERVGFVLAFFVAGVWACSVFEPARLPFSADNQTFYFIAERAASGVPPHASLVNHKLALSMMMSGGAISLGRLLGVDDVSAARILSIALAAATVPLVWALTLQLTRTRLAAVLAGAVMLTFSDYFKQGAMGVRPQLFATFFLLLALVSCANRKAFRSGLFAGASFLCWQPAATVALAVAVAAAVNRDDRRALAWVCCGGAVAFLGYESYFLVNGLLGEQLYQSFAMGLDTSAHKTPSWRDALRFVVFLEEIGRSRGYLFAAGFVAVLAWGWLRVALSPREAWDRLRARPGLLAAALTAHLAVAFTFVDFQAFPDRFVILPFYAVASGFVLALLIAAFSRLPSQYIRAAIAVLTVWLLVEPGLQQRLSTSERTRSLQTQRELAAALDELEGEHGPVWAIGCVHLLGLARRANFDRYGVLIDPRVRASMQRETRSDTRGYRPTSGKMPGVVLTSRHGARRALPWLSREYRPVENREFAQQRITVWIRKPR
jgi:hypothetical protein